MATAPKESEYRAGLLEGSERLAPLHFIGVRWKIERSTALGGAEASRRLQQGWRCNVYVRRGAADVLEIGEDGLPLERELWEDVPEV